MSAPTLEVAGAPAPAAARRDPVRLVRSVAVRLATAALVLLGSATVVFFVQTTMPGDRATLLLNIRTGEAIERTPEELAPINEA